MLKRAIAFKAHTQPCIAMLRPRIRYVERRKHNHGRLSEQMVFYSLSRKNLLLHIEMLTLIKS